jgi:hypothetical protein
LGRLGVRAYLYGRLETFRREATHVRSIDRGAAAIRLGNVLKDAGVSATVFAAKDTTHNKINADLGKPDDPATKALFEFLRKALKK